MGQDFCTAAGRSRPLQNQNMTFLNKCYFHCGQNVKISRSYRMSVQARKFPQVQSQNDILNFKSVDISKQRSAILSNELFRLNS